MKVSVISPFFKVAPFIERCAESLLGQTLQDVEFIFVANGNGESFRVLKVRDRGFRRATFYLPTGRLSEFVHGIVR